MLTLLENTAVPGPVLVLGNSLSTDTRLWDEQVFEWKKLFRVIRFNYPGHGNNPGKPVQSISAIASCLLQMLDGLGVKEFNYCGLSMGGAVGMELASLAQGRLQKLILSNTAAYFGGKSIWDERVTQAASKGMGSLVGGAITRWFTPEAAEGRPDLVDTAREMFISTTVEGYASAAAAVCDFDFRDRLPALAVPSLVIGGSRDPSTPSDATKFISTHAPHAKYVELGVAHLANLNAPAEFTSMVADFLIH